MTIIERVLLLQNIELFNEVTTEQLSFIAAIAREKGVAAGAVLYRENDPADGLYVVISGAIAAKRGEDLSIGSDRTARLVFGPSSTINRASPARKPSNLPSCCLSRAMISTMFWPITSTSFRTS